jgi:response regulator RpfG family c-di-GMP phosphodiesterase
MPVEKAQEILKERSGSQWDPNVIEAFFANLDMVQAVTTCNEVTEALVETIVPTVTGK